VSGELLSPALLLGGLGSAAPGVFLGLLPGLVGCLLFFSLPEHLSPSRW
jgi:hypothetical protein